MSREITLQEWNEATIDQRRVILANHDYFSHEDFKLFAAQCEEEQQERENYIRKAKGKTISREDAIRIALRIMADAETRRLEAASADADEA